MLASVAKEAQDQVGKDSGNDEVPYFDNRSEIVRHRQPIVLREARSSSGRTLELGPLPSSGVIRLSQKQNTIVAAQLATQDWQRVEGSPTTYTQARVVRVKERNG